MSSSHSARESACFAPSARSKLPLGREQKRLCPAIKRLMTLVVLGIGASAMRALPGPMPADVLLVSTAPVFKAPLSGPSDRAGRILCLEEGQQEHRSSSGRPSKQDKLGRVAPGSRADLSAPPDRFGGGGGLSSHSRPARPARPPAVQPQRPPAVQPPRPQAVQPPRPQAVQPPPPNPHPSRHPSPHPSPLPPPPTVAKDDLLTAAERILQGTGMQLVS